RCKKNVKQIDDDALALLKGFDWPGNIRQLENVIERAVVITESDGLTLQDMPAEMFATSGDGESLRPPEAPIEAMPSGGPTFRTERARFEREQIEKALTSAGGNKAEAARILGIARTTLVSRMKKLGLSV